ncbi:MAG: hypothetical protein WA790_15765 [Sulfitobacter sp.]
MANGGSEPNVALPKKQHGRTIAPEFFILCPRNAHFVSMTSYGVTVEGNMKIKHLNASLLTLAASLAVWAGLSGYSDKDVPDPQFLASDLFFQLDGFVFSIPAVALQDVRVVGEDASPLPKYRSDPRLFGKPRWFATSEYKKALHELAGDQTKPASIQRIRINLGVYGTYGEYLISQQICPLLTKEWSQKACVNELRHEHRRLPVNFSLATTPALPADQGATLSARSDHYAPEMTLACDEGANRCEATIAISRDLYAIWSSTCQSVNVEYCLQERRAEGQTILSFAHNQLADGG